MMTLYMLEMRNTQRWEDCRYRSYTTSKDRMEKFRTVPKIQFTDSGHGVVPTVSEVRSRKLPLIVGPYSNADHVAEHMK